MIDAYLSTNLKKGHLELLDVKSIDESYLKKFAFMSKASDKSYLYPFSSSE